MVTDIDQLDFSKKYTYSDYLTWKFSERIELIKGKIFKMAPAPNLRHQEITGDIYGEIRTFLKRKECKVFIAPFDVRLPVPSKKKKSTNTVVQPDITVVCDLSILDKQGCNGSPDLVIEVLSPGNSKREMTDKFNVYQEAKIQEYWLVNPLDEYVIIYSLNKKGEYVGSRPFSDNQVIESKAVKGLKIDLSDIFY